MSLFYKRYGAERFGIPIPLLDEENNVAFFITLKMINKLSDATVTHDLGGQSGRGYTADVTRTHPISGKFMKRSARFMNWSISPGKLGLPNVSQEQFWGYRCCRRKIINDGPSRSWKSSKAGENHSYFPHGNKHHLGLDVT